MMQKTTKKTTKKTTAKATSTTTSYYWPPPTEPPRPRVCSICGRPGASTWDSGILVSHLSCRLRPIRKARP